MPLAEKLQAALDNAVADGVAPGFQLVVFDSDSILFDGVSGLAVAPSEKTPGGERYKPEHVGWLASCAKLTVSIIVLHILERGLTKHGFSLRHLDDPEALAQVLPEFRPSSGHLVTKIIEGFDGIGPDKKKVMKLRDQKGRITLRMLLTHTAGAAYWWSHPLIAELYHPSDGSVPHKGFSYLTGNVSDFDIPAVTEPGHTFMYGHSTDWLGQFAVRSTGRNLRQLFHDILFHPLSVKSSELDLHVSPAIAPHLRPIHVRNGKTDVRNPAARFDLANAMIYHTDGHPPAGKAHFAGGCLFGNARGYAKILQAVLRKDSKLLSRGTWDMAFADDFAKRGIKMPRPLYKTSSPFFSSDVPEFAKTTARRDGEGMNLLTCVVAKAPTKSGRPAGSFGWAGLTNSFYFIDPVNGVGSIVNMQLFPFFDPQCVETRDRLEKIIYDNLGHLGKRR
ncbi:beta-lactamase/transpeptidase-like protein [Gloeophyllum trabeum ATCC 11539]|uniref:Beta-lactamase/transpeptidase-like protein n=1 Tax=Gloeophyllum trabeum (strain ATCC 11539 / FP-39264 / Madison 617) TaxID=670483 RepID=S7RQM8_GLOTA|nr:beta-lactamase/transpeptidase-like protein [Gloeophyllum trabeum ATCC 11539]EPQ56885.1 beta-lactamase/transpeptidase-like protein [Gloeophyllum trabeum ATCC 11539]